MRETLSYASETHERRWSALSLISFGIGLLSPPLLVASFYGMQEIDMDSNVAIPFLLLILACTSLAGVSCGAIALTRIGASGGRLRGGWLALSGLGASVVWPIVAVLWAISKLPNC